MAGKFETYMGSDNKHYFRLKAGNGQIILASEGYEEKAGCANGIKSVRKNAQNISRFDCKQAKDGRVFFNLMSTNGQVIAKSQMYKSKAGCDNGIKSTAINAPKALITPAKG